jgi:hypothetical protein
MSLVPIPSEQPETCANCGSELAPDQRYCLSCGQPVSPVRLAFLDVLQTSRQPAAPAWAATQGYDVIEAGYVPVPPPHGLSAWLRRHSGLLSLLSVLVLCLIAGLLVGHWASQGKAAPTGPQVIRIEGLSAAPAAASAATPSTSAPSSATPANEKGSSKEEAEAAKEAAKETPQEKAPPPPPKKATSTIKKLSTTTGKKHAEEVNALGATPIETG